MNNLLISGRGQHIIYGSLAIAFFTMIIPLPESVKYWRPDGLALCLIYWSSHTPLRVNIGKAWLLGVLLDIVLGSLLGLHAIMYVVISYISSRFLTRLSSKPLLSQMFGVAITIMMGLLIMLACLWFFLHNNPGLKFWQPVLTSVLIWPLLFVILSNFQRNYRLH